MGFVDFLIDTFNGIKRTRELKACKQEYDKYISNIKDELKDFTIIDLKMSENANKYQALLISNKTLYKNEIKLFNSLKEKVKSHNLEVKKLQNVIDSFDYFKIIENPNLIKSKTNLIKYKTAVEKVKMYSNLEPFLNKINSINKIYDNLDLLKKEYSFYKKYVDLFKIEKACDHYISFNEINDYLKPFIELKKNIENVKFQFYNFDKLNHLEKIIEDCNKQYVENNINDNIFSSDKRFALDIEQRKAVLEDETSALIVAGAGSGKTRTIVGKVNYLIKKLKINPKEILLLSYSKESASDLQNRVNLVSQDVEVGTFHKIGLDIIKEATGIIPNVSEQYDAIIEKYFREELQKDEKIEAAALILKYFSLYLNTTKELDKYNQVGELYEKLKKEDYTTLKSLLVKLSMKGSELKTIKKENVKSKQELAIANFYFINGINYEYEKPFEINTANNEKRQYKPDFYLPDYKIYHEHYGIDKNGNSSQFKGDAEINYLKSIAWKRALHKDNKTKCIETFSYEFNDDTVFKKLKDELVKNGVAFNPLSNKQIINCLNSIYNGQSFKSFINLIKSFISLYKSKYTNELQFEIFKKGLDNGFEKKHTTLFLDICKDIYLYYINTIKTLQMIDFDDMILSSVNYLPKLKSKKYRYIIVDEFQDISYSRMIFLKKIIEHGNSKLMAVGDDWQAIYRFAGCDLDIFTNFQKYFPNSVINYISCTHRNSQYLQNIVEPFIKANPSQLSKTIKSEILKPKDPIKIIYCGDTKYNELLRIFESIEKLNIDKNQKNVLILGRNNHDLDLILSQDLYPEKNNGKQIKLHSNKYPNLNLKFSTVHSSKGLESNFVILINAEDSPNGFPNKVEDDPVLNLVLSNKSNFLYDEERRLFYVALTRTKSYVYILVNRDKPSIFIDEIKDRCTVCNDFEINSTTELNYCPKCKTGHLVLRHGNDGEFYGCSNFPYCDYTIKDFKAVNINKRCPLCGDFLIFKQGKKGKFYGCHSYPECKYTKNINNNYSKNKKRNVFLD